uniref:Uncharacterized protein n=1 Tax=Arundo donax TaxID=35708 RepID=A0A0A9CD96_ARUDO
MKARKVIKGGGIYVNYKER